MKLSSGDLIDQKYQVVRMLGTGGMGSVYEATNLRVGRRVALKVMHKVRDQHDVARFEREARAAQIGSPYIVQVHDLGYLSDGSPYMVMEYLAGESLGQRIHRAGKLRPSELLPIVKQVLEALVAAHRAGIVHRDLKPDNVFLSLPEGEDRERVKLVDFGISKFVDASKQVEELSLTRTGVAVGTPQYMSPEQVQGSKDLDARSDLYSLGVMLYRCLGGQLPFNCDDVAPLLVQILIDVPKPLRELAPELDRELIGLVTRAMARRAEDRFQTASDFLNAVVAWEKTHAKDLDAPLVPAGMTSATRTVNHGTAASWSSAAETTVSPSKNWRTVLLASVFSIAGVVGLLVAVKLWTAPRTDTEAGATSAASPGSAAIPPGGVAGDTSPQGGPVAGGVVASAGLGSSPAVVSGPGARAFRIGGVVESASAGASPSTVAAVDAKAIPVASATPEPPVGASTPTPLAPAPPMPPNKGPAPGSDEQSNRHVLGDL